MLEATVDLEVDITSEEVMQAHRDRLMDAADLGFSVSQEKAPLDTGKLKQSGFPPEFRDDDVVFGYTARQAAPMEFGTEPGHYPPVDNLVRWAERIGKDPGFGIWVATEKIPQEGVDASPYLRPAAERMAPFLNNRGLDL